MIDGRIPFAGKQTKKGWYESMKRMKTVLAVVLALTLALSGSALAAADNSVTATAPGLDETVTVTLTVTKAIRTVLPELTDETVASFGMEGVPLETDGDGIDRVPLQEMVLRQVEAVDQVFARRGFPIR